ncbi:MAG: sugar phosphate isomerase/epimerase [Anaerolineae bacterium]|nr:sugar phosphate isomerase/epimerase [Anaerolineae bacterium]
MKLMMFSKHLGELDVAAAGHVIASLGFEGVDLTVRLGGHVLPEHARAQLGPAIRTLGDAGLAVPLVTTGITSAGEPYAADIFEEAARAGVPNLKLGYWRYAGMGTIHSAIDAAQRDLDGIEALAQRTGVRAVIHNHSGDFVSAYAPLVWRLIADRDPAAVGAYVDPGHLMVEGGLGGWRIGLDLLRDRIAVAAFKDYLWIRDESTGGMRMRRQSVPLGQGMVPWSEVVACLRQAGYDGWISVHREYGVQTAQAVSEDMARDVAFLRDLLAQ